VLSSERYFLVRENAAVEELLVDGRGVTLVVVLETPVELTGALEDVVVLDVDIGFGLGGVTGLSLFSRP
jgi:hypothetical protein